MAIKELNRPPSDSRPDEAFPQQRQPFALSRWQHGAFCIRALMESVRTRVQTEAPAIYSKDLIEVIFRHPYTRIRFVVDAGIAKRQTASTYLQTLAGLGILREQKHGREKYYINEALFNELAS